MFRLTNDILFDLLTDLQFFEKNNEDKRAKFDLNVNFHIEPLTIEK